MRAVVVLKGGAGSGHYGHKGIPGHQGGSLSRVSSASVVTSLEPEELNAAESLNLPKYYTGTQSKSEYVGQTVDNPLPHSQNVKFQQISDIMSSYHGMPEKIEVNLDDLTTPQDYIQPTAVKELYDKIVDDTIYKVDPIIATVSGERVILNGNHTILAAILAGKKTWKVRDLGNIIVANKEYFARVVLKQLPISDKDIQKLLNLRVNIFYDKSDKLAEQVFTGDLTIGAWEEAMRAELRQLHSSAAAIAKGGWDNMTSADWGRLGTPLREQYKYLHGFATTIAEQADTISLKAIQARSRMYGRATGNTAALIQAGAVIESLLPWIPGDGSTNCLVNCRCRWDLKVIKVDKKSGDKTVKAVWRLSPAEHCETCIDRNGHIVTIVVPKDVNVPKYIGYSAA